VREDRETRAVSARRRRRRREAQQQTSWPGKLRRVRRKSPLLSFRVPNFMRALHQLACLFHFKVLLQTLRAQSVNQGCSHGPVSPKLRHKQLPAVCTLAVSQLLLATNCSH
jgi:hypothetical protein